METGESSRSYWPPLSGGPVQIYQKQQEKHLPKQSGRKTLIPVEWLSSEFHRHTVVYVHLHKLYTHTNINNDKNVLKI